MSHSYPYRPATPFKPHPHTVCVDPVHIDGSRGEGGGQVLRTAAGLAARTGRPVEVTNIRAKRPKPGLRPQHVCALELVAQACNGQLSGAGVGSSRVRLDPGEVGAATLKADAGTAANTLLMVQALVPLAPELPGPLSLSLTGGTDTKWAPTLVHTRDVLAPLARRAGLTLEVAADPHGFYPKGGGHLSATLGPRHEASWDGVLEERGALEAVEVVVRWAGVHQRIPPRVLEAATGPLERAGLPVEGSLVEVEAPGSGVVVDAVARFEQTVLGANALGERRRTAREVGEACARRLLAELGSSATVDEHASDQLVPLLFDRPGTGFVVRELSGHLETNAAIAGRFLDWEVAFEPVDQGVRVRFDRG